MWDGQGSDPQKHRGEGLAIGVRPHLADASDVFGFLDGMPGTVHVITASDSYHLEDDGYGDVAFDLVLTDAQGSRHDGDGARNEDYRFWDAPVELPATGIVIEVERNLEDNLPGSYEPNARANQIGISIGGSFYLCLLHSRSRSQVWSRLRLAHG